MVKGKCRSSATHNHKPYINRVGITLYNERVQRVTRKKIPMDYTNTGLYRFIYGLYQYMDYTNNERVKRVLYTI